MENTKTNLTRRSLLAGATALAAGAVVKAQGAGKQAPAAPHLLQDTKVTLKTGNAVVETTAGKIWGFTRNGIQTFKGIPYGASTEGKARYMPPRKPEPWTGERCAMWYGKICPQVPVAHAVNEVAAVMWERVEGQPAEDCLNLNVWTPGLDHGKRPVMVWLHGGGFQTGSSIESPSYHGENLARRGDVVVVSVNHRLGVLGFLDLSGCGAQYNLSSNLGMLDLVSALEWVRDNIAGFGGDPGNVTIFGQSGGGGKVTTLLSMPAAKGLFHKAIVQSGSMMQANTREQAAELTAHLLAELGLTAATIDKIHTIPADRMVAAGIVARRKVSPPMVPGPQLARGRQIWGPTLHDTVLPWDPFDPKCLHLSADVPLMVGTTRDEITPVLLDYTQRHMTEAELHGYFERAFGGATDAIIASCRKLYPQAKIYEVASIVSANVMHRRQAFEQATRKAAQGKTPAWYYQFNWLSPIFEGATGSYHCLELPFVFDNTDVCAMETGGGPEMRAMAAPISDAWIHFARTGNPNHPGLPNWPAFKATEGATMVFDSQNSVKLDYERELRQLVVKAIEARS